MLKNFFKVAIRNLWRKKLFSAINIIGLSVGMTCFFLIAVHVKDEFSYDNFHKNGDNLYRVALERIYPDNVVFYAIIPHSLSEAILMDFPEVEKMTRVMGIGGQSVVFRYEDTRFEEDKVFFADSNVFEMFDLPLLEGDQAQVLSSLNGMVMTQATAQRYFGDESALGKRIETPQGEVLVSGVCANLPKNSHLEFDFIGALELLPFIRRPNYIGFSVYTYLQLKDGTDPKRIEEKLPALVERYAAGPIQANSGVSYKEYIAAGNGYNYFLQPINDIHLHSHLTNEIKPNGNILYVYILSAIALFLIVIACINFMNLATARSVSRAREVGIRKIVGSLRGSLIRQFLVESIILSLISMLFAALFVKLILPLFNLLARKQLEIDFLHDPLNLALLLGLGIFVGVLAGSYPAFVLSSYKPATVLKGRFSTSRKGVRLRNALVVLQFAISIILIAMTLVVSQQMDFMQNKDLGFDKDNQIVIERAYALGPQAEAFKQELLNLPEVVGVGGSDTTVQGGFYPGVMFQTEQDSEIKTTRCMTLDDDFISTIGMELKEGRGFSKEFEDTRSVIINEAAIREFGWNEPVGMKLKRINDGPDLDGDYTVIGVVKDFHYNSLHEDIDSFVMFRFPPNQRIIPYLTIKIQAERAGAAVAATENIWSKFNSQEPFSYFYLDDMLADLYQNEQTSGQIFGIFAILAIVIACVGLFGLSAYMAETRTKEIGIRKVLGSSGSKIVVLMSKDFAKLVLIAFALSLPLAYYAMIKWLQSFSFRAPIQIWIFLLAGFMAFAIALLTVSFQAIKAANTDPANTLRFE